MFFFEITIYASSIEIYASTITEIYYKRYKFRELLKFLKQQIYILY